MKKPGIALQVISKVYFPIDDPGKVSDRVFVVTASKIEGCYFIIEHQYPVFVEIRGIFFKSFVDLGDQLYSLIKTSLHEMLIDLCCIQVNKRLDRIVFVIPDNF